jgi:hypothetical protein
VAYNHIHFHVALYDSKVLSNFLSLDSSQPYVTLNGLKMHHER